MAIIHTHIPKRKAKKPNAKQRLLANSWQEILKKYEPKKKTETSSRVEVYKEPTPYRRETAFVPSLGTHQGECTRKQQQSYTGTAMMGIATLHKSNAVPVFTQEDAVEISRMRRG